VLLEGEEAVEHIVFEGFELGGGVSGILL